MPSGALTSWSGGESADRLDEMLGVHVRVGGTRRGRRFATRELNGAIVSQVAAHFQRFCRDLHSEAASALVVAAPPAYQPVLRLWYGARKLDRQNAWPNVLKEDFARFDFDIWLAAEGVHLNTARRRFRLEQLVTWRNAIAHQDFAFGPEQQRLIDGTDLTLAWASIWRRACGGLAQTFDRTVGDQVESITGARPW